MTEKRTREEIDAYAAAPGRRGGLRPMHVTRPAYDKLVFELSSPGRFAYSLPESDVPDSDPAALLPAEHLRAERGRAARGLGSGRDPPLLAPLPDELRRRHPLLSARLVHHEVQPEDQRGHGAAERLRTPAPAGAGGGEPGRAPAHARARAGPRRDLGDGRGVAAARGRRAGRAGRGADDPRLPPGAGRAPPQGADPRLGPRDESRVHRARRLLGGRAQVARPTATWTWSIWSGTSTRTWPRS